MNSFYGGREGAPFIIRKSYIDVPTMIEDFGEGLSNSEVRFGEFVIINTEDKNHPDNGKVFRRNFMGGKIECYTDTKDETGKYIKADLVNGNGAELIGSIAGPAGGAPHFIPMPGAVSEIALDEKGFAIKDEEGNLTYIDVEYDLDRIQDKYKAYDTISASGEFSIPKGNLIPGKEGENFTDKIKWDSYSVRSQYGDDARVFVDFKMPYDVIEFDASTVDAYHNRSDVEYDGEGKIIPESQTSNFDNLNLVERHKDDKGEHPFYQKWQINIPKGIKGQSIKNIRIMEATDQVCDFVLDEKGYIARTEDSKLATKEYNGRKDDIDNKRKIIVCDIVDYDRVLAGDEYIIYIGDYNKIDSVELKDDGEFRIQYAHDDDYARVDDERLTWITSINLNTDNGHLDIDTNNEMKELHTDLTWVKNLTIGETGLLNTETTTGNNAIQNQQLHWIKDIDFSEDGTVTTTEVDGKTKVPFNQLITWIDEWNIDPNTKELYVSLNNESHLINGTEKATTIPLETVNDILVEDGNKFVLQYNTFEEGKPKVRPLGRFIYQGDEAPEDLMTGGLWIETETIDI